jgi:hypothetical protein
MERQASGLILQTVLRTQSIDDTVIFNPASQPEFRAGWRCLDAYCPNLASQVDDIIGSPQVVCWHGDIAFKPIPRLH